jgi:hypothetical protein
MYVVVRTRSGAATPADPRALDERGEVVEHEPDAAPLHERAQEIDPVRARQLAAQLAPERRLAGGVHEERALGERRLREHDGRRRAERRPRTHEAEVTRGGDPGLAVRERGLAAVLRGGLVERLEEPVEDRDAAGLLLLGLALHRREDPLDERPQVRSGERRGAGGVEVGDVHLPRAARLLRERGERLVEEVVVDAVLEAPRHASQVTRPGEPRRGRRALERR